MHSYGSLLASTSCIYRLASPVSSITSIYIRIKPWIDVEAPWSALLSRHTHALIIILLAACIPMAHCWRPRRASIDWRVQCHQSHPYSSESSHGSMLKRPGQRCSPGILMHLSSYCLRHVFLWLTASDYDVLLSNNESSTIDHIHIHSNQAMDR
jgi:hypothetical protein